MDQEKKYCPVCWMHMNAPPENAKKELCEVHFELRQEVDALIVQSSHQCIFNLKKLSVLGGPVRTWEQCDICGQPPITPMTPRLPLELFEFRNVKEGDKIDFLENVFRRKVNPGKMFVAYWKSHSGIFKQVEGQHHFDVELQILKPVK